MNKKNVQFAKANQPESMVLEIKNNAINVIFVNIIFMEVIG